MGVQILSVFALTLLGGLLPLRFRSSHRVLHLFIAFSTGVFLGVVFLHMLPEISKQPLASAQLLPAGEVEFEATQPSATQANWTQTERVPHSTEESIEAAAAHQGQGWTAGAEVEPHDHIFSMWFFVMLGVVGLYIIERLFFWAEEGSDQRRHLTLGWASLVGLAIHAFAAGMGLSAAGTVQGLAGPVFISIIGHKLAESFSLTTIFLLAEFRTLSILLLLLLFSLITPAGIFIGDWVVELLPAAGVPILTALAAGTFLYVALCDLLPEVFHHREDAPAKIALLAGGIFVSLFLSSGGH